MVDPEIPTWKVSDKLRSNARALRKNSTDANESSGQRCAIIA